MKQPLQRGANAVLSEFKGSVVVEHEASPAVDISLTAFLLTDAGKVQGDHGIVFYNQPQGPNGSAVFHAPKDKGNTKTHRIDFDLGRVPAGITKIAVTLTEDKGMGFAGVRSLRAEVQAGGGGFELTPPAFTKEKGITVLELYLKNGQAKARAVWQGYASGLDGLCKDFGVEVAKPAPQKQASPPPQPQKPTAAPQAGPAGAVNLEKVKGKVNLSKGQKPVLIDKTPEITAYVTWASGTDYDIYALVLTKDGRQADVAMFGAQGVAPMQNYKNAVVHMGDIGRTNEAVKMEVIKIRFDDSILAVVPVVYSAQSNGTGSFHRYRVSMCIDNHQGTTVTISSDHANNNDRIYTCVPGVLKNSPDGVQIHAVELYSAMNSENRPRLKMNPNGSIEVLMDQGPRNNYK